MLFIQLRNHGRNTNAFFCFFLSSLVMKEKTVYIILGNQTNTIQTTPTTQRLITAGRAEVRHEEITDSGNHFVVHGSHDGVFHDIVGIFRSGEK
jgi:hypothetical protein